MSANKKELKNIEGYYTKKYDERDILIIPESVESVRIHTGIIVLDAVG